MGRGALCGVLADGALHLLVLLAGEEGQEGRGGKGAEEGEEEDSKTEGRAEEKDSDRGE